MDDDLPAGRTPGNESLNSPASFDRAYEVVSTSASSAMVGGGRRRVAVVGGGDLYEKDSKITEKRFGKSPARRRIVGRRSSLGVVRPWSNDQSIFLENDVCQ